MPDGGESQIGSVELATAKRLFGRGTEQNSLRRSEFAGKLAVCGRFCVEKAFDI
jgi:hypothetical protein